MNARAHFLPPALLLVTALAAACSETPAARPFRDCTGDTTSKLCAPDDSPDATTGDRDVDPNDPDGGTPVRPPMGTYFGTAYVEDSATLRIPSEGDLWPACWSDDDALYTANGDGKGFSDKFHDIALSRVTGSPFSASPNFAGTTVAVESALGQVWTPTKDAKGNPVYNRKPTGMVCVDGALYLAVQDLHLDFLDAPAATIAVSKDHGKTWNWNKDKPMFPNYVMTTLMFLDFGKDNANAIDDYVYVYGIDNNWRFTSKRLSPTKLWLARTPKDKIMDRTAWTYFAGTETDGSPRFDADIGKRQPVLEDATKVYTKPFYTGGARDMTVISQGGIVYNAPLKRYLYTSWTEFTFEFYEAPQPWGPWKKFLSRDFGRDPWLKAEEGGFGHGGYATTIPSKFISPDGRTMFVQSNTFAASISNPKAVKTYELSFRKLLVDKFDPTPIPNPRSDKNLAAPQSGGVPISRAGHAGPTTSLNDGATTGSVDSWTDEEKDEDYWGVVWPHPWTISSVSYTTGNMFPNGGWFSTLRLQSRRNGEWVDVTNPQVTPPYPLSIDAGGNRTYVFTFEAMESDGVRVIGKPGGSTSFTSVSEIAAHYR